jgi:hypothetical protein
VFVLDGSAWGVDFVEVARRGCFGSSENSITRLNNFCPEQTSIGQRIVVDAAFSGRRGARAKARV